MIEDLSLTHGCFGCLAIVTYDQEPAYSARYHMTLVMKKHLFSIGLAGLTSTTLSLPAAARPEIASGDQLLATDVPGCLSLADDLITDLGVESDQGAIDRTGYFEDGSFRILCYGAGEASIAIVFASHQDSVDIASNFIQMALDEMASGSEAASTLPESIEAAESVETETVEPEAAESQSPQ